MGIDIHETVQRIQIEDLFFRQYEKLVNGRVQPSEVRKSGGMLPTCFRTLSVVYVARYFGMPGNYRITKCPGYEF